MSKFLTPPVWYDKTGNKIDILNNETYAATGPDNTAIGTSAIAGSEGVSYGAVAVGCQAHAIGPNSIAIGSYDRTNGGNPRNVEAFASGSIAIGGGAKANADSTDGIAIGRGATSGQGGVAIGAGASAIGDDMIQLGNNNTAYTLNVGKKTYIPGLFDFDSLPKYESSGYTVSDKMRISGLTTGLYIAYFRMILHNPGTSPSEYDCRGYKIFDIVNPDSIGNYELPSVKSYPICMVNAAFSYSENADVNFALNVSGNAVEIGMDKVNFLPISGNGVVFRVYKLSSNPS